MKNIQLDLNSAVFQALSVTTNPTYFEIIKASFNPLQMSYYCLFTCVFISPCIIFDLFKLLKYLWKNKLWFICLTLLLFLLTKFFTVVHPYNLADNRHLVFYAWRLMSKMRWYLVPVYSVSIMLTIFYLPKVKNF